MTEDTFTPRIPGFVDDWTIGAPHGAYASAARGAPRAAGVTPAALRFPRGTDCIPGCLCVTGENCPCCDSLFPWPQIPSWPSQPIRL
jgi:hypothetical protein